MQRALGAWRAPSWQPGNHGSASRLRTINSLSTHLNSIALGNVAFQLLLPAFNAFSLPALQLLQKRLHMHGYLISTGTRHRELTSGDAAQAGLGAGQVEGAVAAVAQQQHIALLSLIAHAAPAFLFVCEASKGP